LKLHTSIVVPRCLLIGFDYQKMTDLEFNKRESFILSLQFFTEDDDVWACFLSYCLLFYPCFSTFCLCIRLTHLLETLFWLGALHLPLEPQIIFGKKYDFLNLLLLSNTNII
jgi:hypothetical protein